MICFIILPFNDKLNSIAHLNDFFQPRDPVPRGASKRNVFWQSFHIQIVWMCLEFLVRHGLGFSAPQGFSFAKEAIQETKFLLKL